MCIQSHYNISIERLRFCYGVSIIRWKLPFRNTIIIAARILWQKFADRRYVRTDVTVSTYIKIFIEGRKKMLETL